MNGRVHGMSGVFVSGVALIMYPQTSFVVASAAVIGSIALALLADIDHAGSSISRIPGFNIISPLLGVILKHRGFTHSLIAVLLLYWALSYNDFKFFLICTWVASYLSHIILDLFNETGVQLLWPFSIKIALLPRLLSVSSRPYSIVQSILFNLFLWLGTLFIVHAMMTISLNHSKYDLLGGIWYKYVVPHIFIL